MTPPAQLPLEFVWTVVAVALTLLALAAWSFFALWVDMRAIRRQQRDIFAMLKNAGFKARRSRGWHDDDHDTQVMGQRAYTDWDWRAKGAGP